MSQQEQQLIITQELRKPTLDTVEDSPRLVSIDSLTVVTTLVAGFVISDVGNFNPADWNLAMRLVYVTCISFTAAVSLYISIVGAMTSMAVRRVQNWDIYHFLKGDMTPEEIMTSSDYEIVMRFCYGQDKMKWTDNGTLKVMCSSLFDYMCDHTCSPLGIGLLLLPCAIVTYGIAFILNLTKAAGVEVQIVATVIMAPPNLAILYFGTHLSRIMRS
uniref:Uncharacterized protein n=1 Tax=Pyrodinium bahamense TaxID=73915 RepID=A0A7S0AGB7_9DINO|mmetsp:Transcript_33928/g.93870  ORF Transcript_33928/g.93870 Transcript_33928/m.93870 type:complete len:216 (+) Transcript_33928:60-707(+)